MFKQLVEALPDQTIRKAEADRNTDGVRPGKKKGIWLIPGHYLFRRKGLYHVIPELLKSYIIQLIREENISPGPPINPLNHLINTEMNCLSAFYRDKMVADLWMPSPLSSDCNVICGRI